MQCNIQSQIIYASGERKQQKVYGTNLLCRFCNIHNETQELDTSYKSAPK